MAKGYVIIRYTGPQHASGAFESWNEVGWKWYEEVAWPVYKKAGANSWRVTYDELGNTPRSMQMIEFDSVEQAIAALASPEVRKLKDQFIEAGTLDLQVTVHSFSREGK